MLSSLKFFVKVVKGRACFEHLSEVFTDLMRFLLPSCSQMRKWMRRKDEYMMGDGSLDSNQTLTFFDSLFNLRQNPTDNRRIGFDVCPVDSWHVATVHHWNEMNEIDVSEH
jgi:hypothetical protein